HGTRTSSLHDALPISGGEVPPLDQLRGQGRKPAGIERRQPGPACAGLASRPAQACPDPSRPKAEQGRRPLEDLPRAAETAWGARSEEHTSELQSRENL